MIRPTASRLILLLIIASLGLGTGQAGLASRHVATPVASPVGVQGLPWWSNAVCYEIFVRSFADSNGDGIGDLNGLIGKLDYLNDGDPENGDDLGVSCVWLMPVMASNSYHGYDVTDERKVEPDYGTNNDFKRFVAEAHRRGIRVVLDLVLNHTSKDHPWFQEALRDPASPKHDWYIWSAENPGYGGSFGQDVWFKAPDGSGYYYATFGEHMPDLNYTNPAVTAEAEEISAFWLNDMGVDGFRLDAIKHLIEEGRQQEGTPSTHAWLRTYADFIRATKPEAFTVGEIFGAGTFTLTPYLPDELDAYFHFELAGQYLNAAAFGSTGFVKMSGEATKQIPDQRFATFLTNHDQTRTMTVLGGDLPAARLAATALLAMPGVPFVYYGEELGVTGTKPDERLRAPMPWSSGSGGGFTTGTSWETFADDPAVLNVAAAQADPDSLLQTYRLLIGLRRDHAALAHGDLVPINAEPRSVVAFVRQAGDDRVLVVINYGRKAVDTPNLSVATSPLPPATYGVRPLNGTVAGAPLKIGPGGAFPDYAPLPSLAPRTAYLFALTAGA
jgi:alpha-amylase